MSCAEGDFLGAYLRRSGLASHATAIGAVCRRGIASDGRRERIHDAHEARAPTAAYR